MPHRTTRGPAAGSRRGPFLVSLAMWANFLQYLGADGARLGDVASQAAITNLNGLLRWGYLELAPDPADDRPKPPRRDWIVTPTPAALAADRVWREAVPEIEARWRTRFGTAADDLASTARTVASPASAPLPVFLPVVWNGRTRAALATWTPPSGRAATREPAADPDALPFVLARALLLFTLECERTSQLPLQLGSNVFRVVGDEPVEIKELPALAGISREAVAMSVKALVERGVATTEPSASGRGASLRITAKGRVVQQVQHESLQGVERAWRSRFGDVAIDVLRTSAETILDRRTGDRATLAIALEPEPQAWRANPPYRSLTERVLSDPREALPRYPMILHRGGYPDGS